MIKFKNIMYEICRTIKRTNYLWIQKCKFWQEMKLTMEIEEQFKYRQFTYIPQAKYIYKHVQSANDKLFRIIANLSYKTFLLAIKNY